MGWEQRSIVYATLTSAQLDEIESICRGELVQPHTKAERLEFARTIAEVLVEKTLREYDVS